MSRALIGGRYELRDILGRGASGVVCEAIDRQIGRLVAVKLMRAPRGAEGAADALAAIRPEAQAAGRLSHPHIVAVHDIGAHEEFVFIVMELVIGVPLMARMRQSPPLPVDDAVRIVVETLGALGHAHSRGVVHRDVKPGNLLLVDDGRAGPWPVKLTDFGIARAAPALRVAGAQPAQDMSGTPAYMAPEQFRLEPADHRADLWAAGVVLYELLAARKPFAGNATRLAVQVASEDPPPLSAARPDLPADLAAVVMRALRRDPAERFQTAAEMAGALAAVRLDAAPGAAGPAIDAPGATVPAEAGDGDATVVTVR